MARLRLSLSRTARVIDHLTGGRLVVPHARLVCLLRVGAARLPVDVWVDTGAPTSVFPDILWKQFEADIEWVTGTVPEVGKLAGHSFRYRYGRVTVEPVSSDLTMPFPPVVMTAAFADDRGAIKRAVMGLWGGVLTGRRLRVEPDLADAFIEDP